MVCVYVRGDDWVGVVRRVRVVDFVVGLKRVLELFLFENCVKV